MARPHIPAPPMAYTAHAKALLVLGLPLIGSHLGQTAIGITDTVMLGWYGVDELAAITLGHTYFFVFFMLGSGFAWAVMPMVAAFDAEGDETSVRRATRMALWLSAAFSLVSLPLLIFAKPILDLLGQPGQVAADAALYLRIAGWGILPALGVMVMKSYLAALGHTQPVLWIILLAAVLNALFNYMFIFGNFGAPELGLAGAAWASNFTQTVSFVAVLAYALRKLPEHNLMQRLWRVDGQMMGRVFALGWPIGLTSLSEVGLFTATAFMMGWLGTIPLAAHGVVVQLASITFMVHMGLSNAATIRAGNAWGGKDRDRLARGAQVATAMSLAFAVLTIILFLTLPKPLISLWLDPADPAFEEVLTLGVGLLAVGALFQLVDGAQVIALGVLRGVQDTKVPMVMAAISYWVVGMPCSYVFGFVLDWEGVGVWMGLVTGLACAAGLLMWRFWHDAVPQVGKMG